MEHLVCTTPPCRLHKHHKAKGQHRLLSLDPGHKASWTVSVPGTTRGGPHFPLGLLTPSRAPFLHTGPRQLLGQEALCTQHWIPIELRIESIQRKGYSPIWGSWTFHWDQHWGSSYWSSRILFNISSVSKDTSGICVSTQDSLRRHV